MLTTSRPQRTIREATEVRGVGYIHSTDVALRFLPADADTGIVFERTDLPGKPSVGAHIANVIPSPRRTTIRHGEATVEMIEHVMAALAGLQIDNCKIEINSSETPGCDGSSLAFVTALRDAGTVEQNRPRPTHVIHKPVTVRDGQAVLTAFPGTGPSLVLSYQLDYGRDTPIGAQSYFSPETFEHELAPCRTFLLEAEAKMLRSAGIGARTSETDLLIFGSDGPIHNTLRYPDECARHKMLDMVGDLALLNKDIVGHVVAHRSGHHLNAELVRKLIETMTPDPLDNDSCDEVESATSNSVSLEIDKIMEILPHRYPFLLVDRVLELDCPKRVVAVKNVTINEPFFQGHWPGRPIMPGVMIIEAIAQAAGLMLTEQVNKATHYTVIAAIDEVKIRKPVTPGDQLRLEVNCLRLKSAFAHVHGVAKVGDQLVAEAKIKFVMIEIDRSAA